MGRRLSKSLYLRIVVLMFMIVLPTVAYSSTCTYSNPSDPAAELTIDEVRNYVRATYAISSGTDELLNMALDHYPSFTTAPFLDVFKLLVREDEIICAFYKGEYRDAIATASKYGIELAVGQTFIGSQLLGVINIASLATLH